MAPAVSILMPVRDAERTLPACLESIRRQRGPSWECVAVDDGSHDGSAACLAHAALRDPRFRVLSQAPSGIVAALEHGLSECRGEYVARMDADDLMRSTRLVRQASALDADPTLAGVGCHVRLFPRTGAFAGRREYERWLNSLESADDVARDAFVECPIAHPSLMLRRSLFERYGYRDAGWPEDYDLVLRLLAGGQRLAVVPERLLCWRDGESRLSRTSDTYRIERFIACKAHFLAQGLLSRSDDYILWGYGDTGRTLARALALHGKRPSAIIELHPGRLGQRILGAPVLEPAALPGLMRERRRPIVASVARPGPRGAVRAALAGFGFVELEDFVCAA
ncbi:MAG TPA: glycosyltransferase [Polyangiaceae bacterium]|nr:glycosyltransferase [Polyangiaceae bacterium]